VRRPWQFMRSWARLQTRGRESLVNYKSMDAGRLPWILARAELATAAEKQVSGDWGGCRDAWCCPRLMLRDRYAGPQPNPPTPPPKPGEWRPKDPAGPLQHPHARSCRNQPSRSGGRQAIRNCRRRLLRGGGLFVETGGSLVGPQLACQARLRG